MKKTKTKTRHVFHIFRLTLFGILAVTVLVARSNSGSPLYLTHNREVLSYASNISITDLLSATNSSRFDNDMQSLALNERLNNSAQLKANDMIENNYWSHSSPDGVEPWRWFETANYSYQVAGENLAYGFSTSKEVATAWMSSPSHKANILGDYEDVGFGIASSPKFQNGQYTVVVAHYGKPKTASVATSPMSEMQNISNTSISQKEVNTNISDLIGSGYTPTVATASIGIVAIVAGGFALGHRAYMRNALKKGKHFSTRHPLIDMVVLGLTVGLILTSNTGHLL